MNNVQLVGRFTKDPVVTYTDGGMSIAKFTMAVDRRVAKEGQPAADFISCTAFGRTAEFLEKWFHKGDRIGLVGRIQTGSYTNKEGQKVYTTEVVTEAVEFVESKRQTSEPKEEPIGDGFLAIPDEAEEEGLPFN